MNRSKILSFCGWGQSSQSLNPLFLKFFLTHQIVNFDYTKFSNIAECFSAVQNLIKLEETFNPEVIVGWSLGGQIACRLVVKGILKPKLLILISTPFQFVKSRLISVAMPKKSFDTFRQNFENNFSKTLEKFSLLMMLNDKRAKELARNLNITQENYQNLVFWLDELSRFSCYDLDFTKFPIDTKTLILQGEDDLVVHQSQALIFANKINNSRLEILPQCGHCPHITNFTQLENIILEELKFDALK